MTSQSEFAQLFEKWWQWVLDDFAKGKNHEYAPKNVGPRKGSPRRIERMNNQMVGLRELGPRHNYEEARKSTLLEQFWSFYQDPDIEVLGPRKIYEKYGFKYTIEFKHKMFLELKRFESGVLSSPQDIEIKLPFEEAPQSLSEIELKSISPKGEVTLPTANSNLDQGRVQSATNPESDNAKVNSATIKQEQVSPPITYFDLDEVQRELRRTRIESEQDIFRLEEKYKFAQPEVKESVNLRIERGAIAEKFKRVSGFKCMICEAMGLNPYSFKKKNSEDYFVEAHHVIPVSRRKTGTLGVTNLMTVCPNHHRQIHYGDSELLENTDDYFLYRLDRIEVKIPKIKIR